jgi:hypothetical protein
MKGHSQADPEGYEAEQKQRNTTPGTNRFLAGTGYASGGKNVPQSKVQRPKDTKR